VTGQGALVVFFDRQAAYFAVWLGYRYGNRFGVDIQTQKP
jgi:hypothetical protein